MRQIKFKGKRKYCDEWVEGYYSYLFNDKVKEYIHQITVQIFEQANIDYPYPTCETISCEVIPETVGQFTGLTDKNGKEIYEGDIVLFTWFSYGEYELETEYQGYIDFLNGSFLFCCEHGNYPLSELEFDSESDIEVIGNIHDNPELLTK